MRCTRSHSTSFTLPSIWEGDALDKVRREENRIQQRSGDTRLNRARYQWLTNPNNMSRDEKQHFAHLRESTLRTARVWAMRQEAMSLWTTSLAAGRRRVGRAGWNGSSAVAWSRRKKSDKPSSDICGNLERSGVKESQRALGKHEQSHPAYQTTGMRISQ